MTNREWAQALPEGWHQLYLQLIDALERIDPDLKVVQAKEKFGALRVYLAAPSPELHALIDAASRASSRTCQTCGREGRLTRSGRGVLAALCDEHAAGAVPADAPIVSVREGRAGSPRRVSRYSSDDG
jgi:hypothetical protein